MKRDIPARTEWKCDRCGAEGPDSKSLPLRWANVFKNRHWDVAADTDSWDLCPECADAFKKTMNSFLGRRHD